MKKIKKFNELYDSPDLKKFDISDKEKEEMSKLGFGNEYQSGLHMSGNLSDLQDSISRLKYDNDRLDFVSSFVAYLRKNNSYLSKFKIEKTPFYDDKYSLKYKKKISSDILSIEIYMSFEHSLFNISLFVSISDESGKTKKGGYKSSDGYTQEDPFSDFNISYKEIPMKRVKNTLDFISEKLDEAMYYLKSEYDFKID